MNHTIISVIELLSVILCQTKYSKRLKYEALVGAKTVVVINQQIYQIDEF